MVFFVFYLSSYFIFRTFANQITNEFFYMKKFRIILPVLLVLLLCSAFTAKSDKNKPVYAFGVSSSFVDTVVYYTNIQILDSAALDKNGFLKEREMYSYQLKNYLELERNLPNRTCVIYFNRDKKKLTKELNKLIGNYRKNKDIVVKQMSSEEFKFVKPE